MSCLINWIHEHWPNVYVIDSIIQDFKLKPENDHRGNIEYKRSLVNCNPKRIQKYTTQMLWRIMQSRKQRAIYYLGVEDDGSVFGLNEEEIKITLTTFMDMLSSLRGTISKIHLMSIQQKYILQVKIKIKEQQQTFYDF